MSLRTYVILANQYNNESDALANCDAVILGCCHWRGRKPLALAAAMKTKLK
jgi:hypothetical protein